MKKKREIINWVKDQQNFNVSILSNEAINKKLVEDYGRKDDFY